MKRRSLPARLGLALAGLGVIGLAPSCTVDTADPDPEPGAGWSEPVPAPVVPAELRAALERDLGQTAAEVERRLLAEARASRVAPDLQARLGDGFAGAWMDADGAQLLVGITDPVHAQAVRDAGATPVPVRWSLARLEAAHAALDRQIGRVDPSIHAWHVDVAGNRVIVHAEDPGGAGAAALLSTFGAEAAPVEVVVSPERPRPYYDVRGGDELIINGNTLCSVGFAVQGGYVTAGHCGAAGSSTAGSNWVAQGTFVGSSFPGNDYAWVRTNAAWQTLPVVTNHSGGVVAVAGSVVAPVNSSTCRSGRTTGWRCGTIQAHGVTINYAAGPVYGATRTSACAQGGDSGGSFLSGNQAQGVTSGGSGNCTSGGTTFYQPVKPILSAYGLSLKTSGGGVVREIVSNFSGRCIDVPWSRFVDGAPLHQWTCNGSSAQRWTFVDGTVRAGGLCMDVAWGSTANGATIQLAHCSGHPAQQFTLTAAGDLVSVLANKCVDVKDWNPNNGARLQTWSCAGTANQRWHLR
jgi:streptogrisin C